jgi:Terminase small subunit
LRNAEIRQAIADAEQKRGIRTEISADKVLRELGDVGFSDIRELMDRDGRPLTPDKWPCVDIWRLSVCSQLG